MLTGHPTLPAALRAINEGKVYQFFTKPCNEIDLAISIRHALAQKDLMIRSRDLLEVAKRQSVLIDEARVLRRLKDLPHKERAHSLAKGDKPMDSKELIEEIEQEINKSRNLLTQIHDENEV